MFTNRILVVQVNDETERPGAQRFTWNEGIFEGRFFVRFDSLRESIRRELWNEKSEPRSNYGWQDMSYDKHNQLYKIINGFRVKRTDDTYILDIEGEILRITKCGIHCLDDEALVTFVVESDQSFRFISSWVIWKETFNWLQFQKYLFFKIVQL